MKYFRVECGNGYCGCDEEWLMQCEEEPEWWEIRDLYSYAEGAANICPKNEEDEDYDPTYDITYEEYEEGIAENLFCEEITKEEFERLKDEEQWEVI